MKPEAARPYLTAEFGHYCFRCGLQPDPERPRMDVDHIIPVARGGRNHTGNYQYLCGPCNSWKGTKIIDFRPGDPRKIEADLPIIPNEERVRKSSVKLVPLPVPEPIIQTVVERVQVPIMVPVPPPAHNCYDALPRLFSEYTRSMTEIARLSERLGKAEAERAGYQDQWRNSYPFGCILTLAFLTLIASTAAIYFYAY